MNIAKKSVPTRVSTPDSSWYGAVTDQKTARLLIYDTIYLFLLTKYVVVSLFFT